MSKGSDEPAIPVRPLIRQDNLHPLLLYSLGLSAAVSANLDSAATEIESIRTRGYDIRWHHVHIKLHVNQ
jgi:hypothetical protein